MCKENHLNMDATGLSNLISPMYLSDDISMTTFPSWIKPFDNECLRIIGSKSAEKLEELVELYLKYIKMEEEKCMGSPNRAALIARNMYKILRFFHLCYREVKETKIIMQWSELMVELLAHFCQFEMCGSQRWLRGRDTDANVSLRIMTMLWMCLNADDESMLHVLLKIRCYSKRNKVLFEPIFKKLLVSKTTPPIVSDMDYVRKLLVFKTWKKICPTKEKSSISELAMEKLQPPPNFAVNCKKYMFLPKYPETEVDVNKYLIKTFFDLDQSVKKYFNYINDKHYKSRLCLGTVDGEFLYEIISDNEDDEDCILLDQIKTEVRDIRGDNDVILINEDSCTVASTSQATVHVIDLTEDSLDITDNDTPLWVRQLLDNTENQPFQAVTEPQIQNIDSDLEAEMPETENANPKTMFQSEYSDISSPRSLDSPSVVTDFTPAETIDDSLEVTSVCCSPRLPCDVGIVVSSQNSCSDSQNLKLHLTPESQSSPSFEFDGDLPKVPETGNQRSPELSCLLSPISSSPLDNPGSPRCKVRERSETMNGDVYSNQTISDDVDVIEGSQSPVRARLARKKRLRSRNKSTSNDDSNEVIEQTRPRSLGLESEKRTQQSTESLLSFAEKRPKTPDIILKSYEKQSGNTSLQDSAEETTELADTRPKSPEEPQKTSKTEDLSEETDGKQTKRIICARKTKDLIKETLVDEETAELTDDSLKSPEEPQKTSKTEDLSEETDGKQTKKRIFARKTKDLIEETPGIFIRDLEERTENVDDESSEHFVELNDKLKDSTEEDSRSSELRAELNNKHVTTRKLKDLTEESLENSESNDKRVSTRKLKDSTEKASKTPELLVELTDKQTSTRKPKDSTEKCSRSTELVAELNDKRVSTRKLKDSMEKGSRSTETCVELTDKHTSMKKPKDSTEECSRSTESAAESNNKSVSTRKLKDSTEKGSRTCAELTDKHTPMNKPKDSTEESPKNSEPVTESNNKRVSIRKLKDLTEESPKTSVESNNKRVYTRKLKDSTEEVSKSSEIVVESHNKRVYTRKLKDATEESPKSSEPVVELNNKRVYTRKSKDSTEEVSKSSELVVESNNKRVSTKKLKDSTEEASRSSESRIELNDKHASTGKSKDSTEESSRSTESVVESNNKSVSTRKSKDSTEESPRSSEPAAEPNNKRVYSRKLKDLTEESPKSSKLVVELSNIRVYTRKPKDSTEEVPKNSELVVGSDSKSVSTRKPKDSTEEVSKSSELIVESNNKRVYTRKSKDLTEEVPKSSELVLGSDNKRVSTKKLKDSTEEASKSKSSEPLIALDDRQPRKNSVVRKPQRPEVHEPLKTPGIDALDFIEMRNALTNKKLKIARDHSPNNALQVQKKTKTPEHDVTDYDVQSEKNSFRKKLEVFRNISSPESPINVDDIQSSTLEIAEYRAPKKVKNSTDPSSPRTLILEDFDVLDDVQSSKSPEEIGFNDMETKTDVPQIMDSLKKKPTPKKDPVVVQSPKSVEVTKVQKPKILATVAEKFPEPTDKDSDVSDLQKSNGKLNGNAARVPTKPQTIKPSQRSAPVADEPKKVQDGGSVVSNTLFENFVARQSTSSDEVELSEDKKQLDWTVNRKRKNGNDSIKTYTQRARPAKPAATPEAPVVTDVASPVAVNGVKSVRFDTSDSMTFFSRVLKLTEREMRLIRPKLVFTCKDAEGASPCDPFATPDHPILSKHESFIVPKVRETILERYDYSKNDNKAVVYRRPHSAHNGFLDSPLVATRTVKRRGSREPLTARMAKRTKRSKEKPPST